jgi:hypothetical protein
MARAELEAPADVDPELFGLQLADALRAEGAADILAALGG